VITDGAHGRTLTLAEVGLALLKNFRPDKAPRGYTFTDLLRQFTSQTGARGKKVGEFETDADQFEWRVLFIAGMWFQDLFNYDFRRTEMCIIPYGTQMGEISFCAYKTGAGWRQIVEKMLANATVADWYRVHGRHAVYAKGREPDTEGPARVCQSLTTRLPGVPEYVKSLNDKGRVKLRVLG
jgi:uncharacterized radical SAM superfamily Fe-S cluster-containing enzyme